MEIKIDMYNYMHNHAYRFEWDKDKNLENIEKHGVSFWEAKEAFFDPNNIVIEDEKHSETEDRFYCVGRIFKGIVTVRFTYRNTNIRIIGAGYWRKGRYRYEQKNNLH